MQSGCRRHERGLSGAALALAVLLAVAATLGTGCGSTKQHEYRELREYALDESIAFETRREMLMAMARDEDEETHFRAVAIQMLGILQVEEAQPIMLALLGKVDETETDEDSEGDVTELPANDEDPFALDSEGDEEPDPAEEAARAELAESPWLVPEREAQPAESELLRMEAVIALGRFADPELYDEVLQLIYEERRDPSPLVVRQFVQSFAYAPAFPEPGALETAEALFNWMRLAIDRNEDENIVYTALHELRRLVHRPDLDATAFAEWSEHFSNLRRGDEIAEQHLPWRQR